MTCPCSPFPQPLVAAGDVISRLTSDTTIVSDLVSQNINIFLRNVVKATGVIFFMFSLSWKLSLVTFMGFPIIMLVSDVYGKYYKVGRSSWRGCGVLQCWAVPLLRPLWVTLVVVGLMFECFVAGSGGRMAALNMYEQTSVASALPCFMLRSGSVLGLTGEAVRPWDVLYVPGLGQSLPLP